MSSEFKKRKFAGPTHGEIKREEATPEKHSKRHRREIKNIIKKVCCRLCGFMMGKVELEDNSWRTWRVAMSNKFGTCWPYCKNCKVK